MEGKAASHLCNKDDESRLGWREIRDGWGSNTNFMLSHGLKPWDEDDCEEALAISRGYKSSEYDDADDDDDY